MAEWEINDFTNLLPLPENEHHKLHKPPHLMGDWKVTEEPYWNTDNDEEYKERALAAVRAYIREEINNQ